MGHGERQSADREVEVLAAEGKKKKNKSEMPQCQPVLTKQTNKNTKEPTRLRSEPLGSGSNGGCL